MSSTLQNGPIKEALRDGAFHMPAPSNEEGGVFCHTAEVAKRASGSKGTLDLRAKRRRRQEAM
jgi:hypothetical protein